MADELKLTMDDDGYTILNKADLADWLPKINPDTKTWIVGGEDTLVLAEAPTIKIDDATGHWFINDKDSGENAKGLPGDQGPAGRDALSFKIGTVTEVSHDHSPSVTATADTDGNVTLDFELVAGLNGQDGKDAVAPTFQIGTVTTGDAPSVTDNVSSETNVHTLDFVIPHVDMSNYTDNASLTQKLANKVDTQKLVEYYDAKSVDKLLALKADVQSVANVANKDDVQQLKNANDTLVNRVDELTAKVADLTTRLVALEQKQTTK